MEMGGYIVARPRHNPLVATNWRQSSGCDRRTAEMVDGGTNDRVENDGGFSGVSSLVCSVRKSCRSRCKTGSA